MQVIHTGDGRGQLFAVAQPGRIRATLYYQVAWREHLEFLKLNGGLDGEALFGLWSASKSPPQVIQTTWHPNYPASSRKSTAERVESTHLAARQAPRESIPDRKRCLNLTTG